MRLIACKHCGLVFETDKRGAYLCPACALKSRRESVLRERTCIDCGAKFVGYPKSKRCPECRDKINAKRDAEYKKRGAKRKLGTIDKCQRCGAEYIVNSGAQRYCPACAESAHEENVKAHKREYMRDHAEEFAPKKAKNRSYNKVCVVCGKIFDAETTTVTCSSACAEKWKRYNQSKIDYKRGKRKTVANIEIAKEKFK